MGPAAGVAGAGLGGWQFGSWVYGMYGEAFWDWYFDDTDTEDCPPDDEECEKLYRVDTETCNAITKRRGSIAGEACHRSATERYAACLRGKPIPPLNTWNN